MSGDYTEMAQGLYDAVIVDRVGDVVGIILHGLCCISSVPAEQSRCNASTVEAGMVPVAKLRKVPSPSKNMIFGMIDPDAMVR